MMTIIIFIRQYTIDVIYIGRLTKAMTKSYFIYYELYFEGWSAKCSPKIVDASIFCRGDDDFKNNIALKMKILTGGVDDSNAGTHKGLLFAMKKAKDFRHARQFSLRHFDIDILISPPQHMPFTGAAHSRPRCY